LNQIKTFFKKKKLTCILCKQIKNSFMEVYLILFWTSCFNF